MINDEHYSEHWQKSIQLLWNVEEVVAALDRRFSTVSAHRILDASCGTGEFTAALAKRGYAVDCSDADPSMVACTEKTAEQAGVSLEPCIASWKELSGIFSGEYDAVMMRGNSLPYVISWDKISGDTQKSTFDLDLEKADEELLASFKAVYEQLRVGGVFYFDMRHVYEKEGKEMCGEGIIDGKPASLTFDVTYRGYVRTIISELQIGEEKDVRVYNSYRLPFEKLDDLLLDAGFALENIRHCVALRGENVYTPYFVKK